MTSVAVATMARTGVYRYRERARGLGEVERERERAACEERPGGAGRRVFSAGTRKGTRAVVLAPRPRLANPRQPTQSKDMPPRNLPRATRAGQGGLARATAGHEGGGCAAPATAPGARFSHMRSLCSLRSLSISTPFTHPQHPSRARGGRRPLEKDVMAAVGPRLLDRPLPRATDAVGAPPPAPRLGEEADAPAWGWPAWCGLTPKKEAPEEGSLCCDMVAAVGDVRVGGAQPAKKRGVGREERAPRLSISPLPHLRESSPPHTHTRIHTHTRTHTPLHPALQTGRAPLPLPRTCARARAHKHTHSMHSHAVRPATPATGGTLRSPPASRGAVQVVGVATPSRPPTSYPAKR